VFLAQHSRESRQVWRGLVRSGAERPVHLPLRVTMPSTVLRNVLWGWKWIGVYGALFVVIATLWAHITVTRPDLSPLAAPIVVIWLWTAGMAVVCGAILGILRPLTYAWPRRVVASGIVAGILLGIGFPHLFKWAHPLPSGWRGLVAMLGYGLVGAWVFAPARKSRPADEASSRE
jgi:hypothetical protein